MDVMYKQIGRVSETTISELRDVLSYFDSQRTWECHISDVTHHHAVGCMEQMKTVSEICSLWPTDSWNKMTFLRLPPSGKLYRHADQGFGFHIPVETNDQTVSLSYENGIRKEYHLEVGKVYSVDRSIEHESFNNGGTDRTHLIVIQK